MAPLMLRPSEGKIYRPCIGKSGGQTGRDEQMWNKLGLQVLQSLPFNDDKLVCEKN